MAYSELIKNFDRIRPYIRQFYVYGFKNRTEYDQKSARSYDNERRRIESWLGDCMRFRQTPGGKTVFLSVDSRSIPHNPLYKAFKAKSFTAGDVTFHFYVLDLLQDGAALTAQEILSLFWEKYLCCFESDWQPDISTVRKKLKEYVSLGLLQVEKRGRELVYRRSEDRVPLKAWENAAAFFSEEDPLGVIGSTLLDKLGAVPDCFQFKHHYILHALDSQILLQLLTAIGEKRAVRLTNASRKRPAEPSVHTVCPLQIFISTQGGRQYLLCWHQGTCRPMFFRLDYIQTVELLDSDPESEACRERCRQLRAFLWGTSVSKNLQTEHLEMTIHFDDDEPHIPLRLEREKRNGIVERTGPNTCRYTADVYDASELLPWLRTFIGRIEKLECSNEAVVQRFYDDLDQTCALYGGDA